MFYTWTVYYWLIIQVPLTIFWLEKHLKYIIYLINKSILLYLIEFSSQQAETEIRTDLSKYSIKWTEVCRSIEKLKSELAIYVYSQLNLSQARYNTRGMATVNFKRSYLNTWNKTSCNKSRTNNNCDWRYHNY